MKLFSWFNAVFNFITVFFKYVAGVILVGMLLLIIYEIATRYFFVSPQGWTVEVTEYMLLYICFLGTAWLLRHEGHVTLDLLYDRLNPRYQFLLKIIVPSMGTVMCLVLTWFTAGSTLDHFQRNELIGTLDIPRGVILAVLPLSFFMLTVEFLRKIFAGFYVRSSRKETLLIKEHL